jgi:hypothetical protein
MGKYIEIQTRIFNVFNLATWKAEKIKTLPNNFVGNKDLKEFIRVSIIPSGTGINLASISGVLIIDIFCEAGNGPTRSFTIADKLDSYLVGQALIPSAGVLLQFRNSAFSPVGLDTDDPSMFRSTYTIPFNYTEVQ